MLKDICLSEVHLKFSRNTNNANRRRVWLVISGYLSVVSANPFKGSYCFIEQDALVTLLSTGWFRNRLEREVTVELKWATINNNCFIGVFNSFDRSLFEISTHVRPILYTTDSLFLEGYVVQRSLILWSSLVTLYPLNSLLIRPSQEVDLSYTTPLVSTFVTNE